ncbi:MAG: ABC transporter permease [Nevskiaceae bacterium]|nr:MAG: ABC transporter permease [Nevskiaceae bacterium]TBR73260.1 MAG: ABC transporter permease [Nevskiaceae bacterium]
MRNLNGKHWYLYGYAGLYLIFNLIPFIALAFVSFGTSSFVLFPMEEFSTEFYTQAFQSGTIHTTAMTSFKIAIFVTIISMIVGFFGALAFARYRWRFRSVFQKFILLPIFFPQAVLGLALSLWFNTLNIDQSWQTAMLAHLVWITPIATLIAAIPAYSFDANLEDAAFDLGATRFQVFREITLPLLWPGVVAAGMFAFLLSWGNFALSLYTDGVDQTLPQYLFSRMTQGYTPVVPAVAVMAAGLSILVIGAMLLISWMVRVYRQRRSVSNLVEFAPEAAP